MPKTLFILGAGASAQAGVPLMNNFMDMADELRHLGKVKEHSKQFDEVFNGKSYLQGVHSKSRLDLDNIEVLFSAFEMAEMLDKSISNEGIRLVNLVESLKTLISVTIEEKLQLPVEGSRVVAPYPYGEFINLIDHLTKKVAPKHSVSIITFNYDLACDYALYLGKFRISYGLPKGSGDDEVGIPLLKLHGSLNWTSAESHSKKSIKLYSLKEHFDKHKWFFETFETDNPPDSVMLKITSHLKDLVCSESDVDGHPVIVPPTWNKSNYHRGIEGVWRRAAKELGETENIFVIGYSLPEADSFFRYLYSIGTASNTPLKRFYVFDPDRSGNVHERFKRLLGPGVEHRYKEHRMTFERAIGEIKDIFRGY